MFKLRVDEGIELRLRVEEDADPFFALIDKNRVFLREWLPWVDRTSKVEDVQAAITGGLAQFEQNTGYVFGIWYQGKAAGIISLVNISRHHKRATIGYWLGAEFTGCGIMIRACRKVIDFAFSELELHRVEIQCAKKNLKSRAIPEGLGFLREGVSRESEYLYDHYVTHILYGLLKEEWV